MALKGFKVTRPPILDITSPTGKLKNAEAQIEFLEKYIEDLESVDEPKKALNTDGNDEAENSLVTDFFELFSMTKVELAEKGTSLGIEEMDQKSHKDQLLKDIFEKVFSEYL